MNSSLVFAVACALMSLAGAHPGRTDQPRWGTNTCEERYTDCTTACAAQPETCAECDSKKATCEQIQACVAIKSVCVDCKAGVTCEAAQQEQCDACQALRASFGSGRGGNWEGRQGAGQDHHRWVSKTCEERFADCTTACTARPETCAECDSKRATCEQIQACIAIKSVCVDCEAGVTCEAAQQEQCDACQALRASFGSGRGGNWKGRQSGGQDHQRWGSRTCEERYTDCTTACAAQPETCAECDSKKATCDQIQACVAIKSVCVDCKAGATCEAAQQEQCDACQALRASFGRGRGGNWEGRQGAGQDHHRWVSKTCEERFADCTTACTAQPETCVECYNKKATCEQIQACIAIKSVCVDCKTGTRCEAVQQEQCDACHALWASFWKGRERQERAGRGKSGH